MTLHVNLTVCNAFREFIRVLIAYSKYVVQITRMPELLELERERLAAAVASSQPRPNRPKKMWTDALDNLEFDPIVCVFPAAIHGQYCIQVCQKRMNSLPLQGRIAQSSPEREAKDGLHCQTQRKDA